MTATCVLGRSAADTTSASPLSCADVAAAALSRTTGARR